MAMMFDNMADACAWLYAHGWRQDDLGTWRNGKRVAEIRRSPAGDSVVSVSLWVRR